MHVCSTIGMSVHVCVYVEMYYRYVCACVHVCSTIGMSVHVCVYVEMY